MLSAVGSRWTDPSEQAPSTALVDAAAEEELDCTKQKEPAEAAEQFVPEQLSIVPVAPAK
jgi:hypothetical protein